MLISCGVPPLGGVKQVRVGKILAIFLSLGVNISKTVAGTAKVTINLIGSDILAFH